jgi:fructose-specific phosphotransferase system IIB component
MKIVAVTACPVGMAHTYMASAALIEAAKKNGIEIKVETQGMSGIKNKITKADLKDTDVVIMTKDVVIEEFERFNGMPTFKTTTSQIIKKTDEVIQAAIDLVKGKE